MITRFSLTLLLSALVSITTACGATDIQADEKTDEQEKSEQAIDISHPYPDMELAARAGNVKAQFNMGVMYDEGEVVQENDEKAVYWYKQAADLGFAPAQMSLGEMYQKGLGVKEDFGTAIKYYHSSAQQGNVKAQLTLGLLYQTETSGMYNEAASANWFRLAAKQGHNLGMTRIGAKYADGRGVEKDLMKAYAWSHLGAQYGNKEASGNIEKIAQELKNTEIIIAKDIAKQCLNSAFVNCD